MIKYTLTFLFAAGCFLLLHGFEFSGSSTPSAGSLAHVALINATMVSDCTYTHRTYSVITCCDTQTTLMKITKITFADTLDYHPTMIVLEAIPPAKMNGRK